MSRTYRFRIPGNPAEFISKARELARENGVTINGDSNRGSVKGAGVEGDYRVDGKTAVLVIKKKPLYAPWWLVGKELSGFFGGPTLR